MQTSFAKKKLNGDNHPLTINNFPQTLQICQADINTAFNLKKQRGPRSKFSSGGAKGECVKETFFCEIIFCEIIFCEIIFCEIIFCEIIFCLIYFYS